MSRQEANAPHPRKEPRFPGPLSLARLEEVFSDCVDFSKREVFLHGDSQRRATVCYIDGQARTERLNDYVLRPTTPGCFLFFVCFSRQGFSV